MTIVDLNAERTARAAKREGGGGPVKVPFGKQTFELPAELPAEVLERLLDPDVEIAQLLIAAIGAYKNGTGDENAGAIIAQVLTDRPDLPLGFVRALMGAVEELFGPEQWAGFKAEKPSAQDMVALVKGLFSAYAVNLGEAFRSSGSSATGGTTSKRTSSASTASTPAASGLTLATPPSSASAG